MSEETSKSPWWAVEPEEPPVKVARGRLRRRAGIGGALALGFLVLAAFAAPVDQPRALSNGVVQEPATLSDLVASCAGITTWPTADASGWLRSGSTHAYAGFPPTSGTFSPEPLAPGFYSKATAPGKGRDLIPSAVSNLWRGQMVVWYRPDIPPEDLASLKTILEREIPQGTYVALPWPEDLINRWTSRRPIMLSGWGLSQGCRIGSPDVIKAFQTRIAQQNPPGEGNSLTDPGPRFEMPAP